MCVKNSRGLIYPRIITRARERKVLRSEKTTNEVKIENKKTVMCDYVVAQNEIKKNIYIYNRRGTLDYI